jgi:hypothetical protein
MSLKNLFILLLIGQFTTLFSQTPMVAYRKEGIWYYFDTKGKYLWEPFADVAASPGGWQNGLLKATRMEIVGTDATNIGMKYQQVLYDAQGRAVFVPKIEGFYRIISSADKAGLVHIISSENEHIILCDTTGKMVYESPNTTAQYMGNGVVAYLKNEEEQEGIGDKNYILFDVKNKKEIATIKCSGFVGNYEDEAIFCYNDKSKWGMLNLKGKLIQPMIWDSDLLDYEGRFPLEKGFIALKSPQTERLCLLNKNGEVVLKDIDKVTFQSKHFLSCEMTVEGAQIENFYILQGTQIKQIDEKYGDIEFGTEGGIFIAEDEKSNLTFMDKSLKSITKMKAGKKSEIQFFPHHIWLITDEENTYNCYDEKGVKTGLIKAENLGNPAYGHVFFKQNNLWGLADLSGKIVIQPKFAFDTAELPDIQNGFFSESVTLSNDSFRFDFYDFNGKLVMSTTSDKDGWDYLVTQEEVLYYRHL